MVKPTPFGRYLLVERLAQGGMAQVYRAILHGGPGFEKQVALKRVLKELSEDPEFVMRFGDEARIASTLGHSNIVQVFDFGEVDGDYFIAMELVDGPDLGTLLEATRMRGQTLPVPVALHIAGEAARGLGAAHTRTNEDGEHAPVVHRDVSPQNVMLSRAGEVKIADFGIAKAANKAMKTRTGMVMGKVRYMAPEQAMGEDVDARADVFALGAVLFELLTGRPLFGGGSPQQILTQVLNSPIPAPSSLAAKVPTEVDAIVLRALERNTQRRFADGQAMAREIEHVLHTTAPSFSPDDLSALIQQLLPRRRPSLPPEQLATMADEEPLIVASTVADQTLAASLQPTEAQAPEREETLAPVDAPLAPPQTAEDRLQRVTSDAQTDPRALRSEAGLISISDPNSANLAAGQMGEPAVIVQPQRVAQPKADDAAGPPHATADQWRVRRAAALPAGEGGNTGTPIVNRPPSSPGPEVEVVELSPAAGISSPKVTTDAAPPSPSWRGLTLTVLLGGLIGFGGALLARPENKGARAQPQALLPGRNIRADGLSLGLVGLRRDTSAKPARLLLRMRISRGDQTARAEEVAGRLLLTVGSAPPTPPRFVVSGRRGHPWLFSFALPDRATRATLLLTRAGASPLAIELPAF